MGPPGKIHDASNALGDETLSAWMAQYGAALRRYFARRVGPADADDLVQEVFLSLQRSASEATVENVESFLFTVARRVLVARYRGEKGYRLLDFQDQPPSEPDDISPERILTAKQEYARAIVAINELPPRMQMAFVLHRFGKLSYSAIAKRMGITKASVQVLMRRAIERVASGMEERS